MGRTRWSNQKVAIIGGMVHCILQGVLVPLLIDFLASLRLKKGRWPFKLYVAFVNALVLGQTIVQLYDIVDSFDSESRVSRPAVLVLTPVLNVTISASVQLFFIFRCWKIYTQRVVFVLPLLALWFTALIPGLLLGYYMVESVKRDLLQPASIALGIWTFSSLTLELCVTTSSLVRYNNVFKTIWQVTWVSAALPPILVIIAVINGYIVHNIRHPITVVTVDMTGKAYALSLMITIVGRGHIRAQLEKSNARSELAPVLTRANDTPTAALAHTESNSVELRALKTLHLSGLSKSQVLQNALVFTKSSSQNNLANQQYEYLPYTTPSKPE
ncbi:hypothetical protein RhiXN_01061 [Rhizoctonia solani]|uniref:Uncharacterized protein n=1 Tax=Rhizoctonia solani TaxID=456999 RepID=A0A8H8NUN9_9AGAM|nr:uncharacterized protein RhiXN_01061 [Rhizoctonia solani]QRW19655.1 hypothetical protein RhiXN_01061 [Rhizoctonia solani]